MLSKENFLPRSSRSHRSSKIFTIPHLKTQFTGSIVCHTSSMDLSCPHNSNEDSVVNVSNEESDFHYLDPVPEEPFSKEHIKEAFGILCQRAKEKQFVQDTRLSFSPLSPTQIPSNFFRGVLQLKKIWMVFETVTK